MGRFRRVAQAAVAVGTLAAAAGWAALPAATPLPPALAAALERANVPAEALGVVVHDLTGGRRVLQWQADKPLNPASLTKLLTTAWALDRLGPAWAWSTPVWLQGSVRDGVLEGSVVIKGSGDPQLVMERVWLLLRRIQQQGVREIRGDIVLDGSAFDVPEVAPGEFDGESLRPYNVRSAALLLNYRSVRYTFVPEAGGPSPGGVARVLVEPPLAEATVERTVPLSNGPCGDWRAALKASFEPGRTRFAGSYPAACGELAWTMADPQPRNYDARLIEGLWREMGGQLQGSVREGRAPSDVKPTFELRSPALAEVVRDINKYSNNLMAQQLFLSVPLAADGVAVATPEAAREALLRWLALRTGERAPEVVIDNGSGLSRLTRLSAGRLAQVLVQAYASPVMSELMSSLPVTGLDGTLRHAHTAIGRAHLKTGSLRDVTAVAGYVLAASGRRYVLVAIINHPRAPDARPALEALLQWVLRDPAAR
jgi:D-alanyl-D-alanine carboxypeptidase/D-alanyl-D-alanine-endopeptidase (penicillin-binding protein 4)